MKKIFYILSAAVVMATGCNRETVPEQESVLTTTVAPEEGAMMLVTFDVSIPDAMLYSEQTRAGFSYQPVIQADEIYVAVFGAGESDGLGGNLQNFVKAKLVRDNQTNLDPPIRHNFAGVYGSTPTGKDDFKYKYEVLLPMSNDPLVLDFMVGACDSEGVPYTLDHPLPVGYEKEVMQQVTSWNDQSGFWQRKRISGVFPKMVNGEYVMTQYMGTNNRPLPVQNQDYVAEKIPELEEVVLIRNFAIVTFRSADNANFQILNYGLVDTPKTGSIAPYSNADGFNTAYTHPATTTPSILMAGYRGYVSSYELNSGFQGWFPPSWGNVDSSAMMYERTIPTNSDPAYAETGAILEVNWYNSLNKRYYKVSLVDENGYVPILRNIVYQFIVSEINADYHPRSMEEALAGPFLGDISASVTTSMLDEISNNKSSIRVAGSGGNSMSYTAIGSGKTIDVDFYFYPSANNSNEVVVTDGKTAANGKVVTIKKSIESDGDYPQAIASVSDVRVTPKANGSDDHGTITVTLNDSEPGVVKKGKLKILGQVQGTRALYREVSFTVMEKQQFANGSAQTRVSRLSSDAMNQETTVTLVLPNDLPRDIFPLQIKIEAQNNCLTSIPDKTVTPNISALPVKYGPSAFDSNKNSYYFVKTITFDDYATLNGTSYEYTNEFPCKFKTRLSSGNPTAIKVNDLNGEFFVEKDLQLTAN